MDGSGRRALPTRKGMRGSGVDFSPDGSMLAITFSKSGPLACRLMSPSALPRDEVSIRDQMHIYDSRTLNELRLPAEEQVVRADFLSPGGIRLITVSDTTVVLDAGLREVDRYPTPFAERR